MFLHDLAARLVLGAHGYYLLLRGLLPLGVILLGDFHYGLCPGGGRRIRLIFVDA